MNRENSSAGGIIVVVIALFVMAMIGLLGIGAVFFFWGYQTVQRGAAVIEQAEAEVARAEADLEAQIAEAEAQDQSDQLHGLNAEIYDATVAAVLEGDTIQVLKDGERQSVRLHGIDCPEAGQAYGDKARQLSTELCLNKDVLVVVAERDDDGRQLAAVYLKTARKDIRVELLKAGLAWQVGDPDDKADLVALETDARKERTGLWADDEPTPPWKWRERQTPP